MTETLPSCLPRGIWRKKRLGHEARTASEIISPGTTSQEPKFIRGIFPLRLGGLRRKGFWGDRASKAWNSVPRRKHDHGQGPTRSRESWPERLQETPEPNAGKAGLGAAHKHGEWGRSMPVSLQLRVSRVFRGETGCMEASMHVALPRGRENDRSVCGQGQ